MLITKNDFVIDQVVACKHVGNRARYDKGMTLGKVIRISKKYITVAFREDDNKGIKFEIDEGYESDYLREKSDMSGSFEMFPSEQSYYDYEEKEVKIDEIKTVTGNSYNKSTLTIDQVRRIHDIIKE